MRGFPSHGPHFWPLLSLYRSDASLNGFPSTPGFWHPSFSPYIPYFEAFRISVFTVNEPALPTLSIISLPITTRDVLSYGSNPSRVYPERGKSVSKSAWRAGGMCGQNIHVFADLGESLRRALLNQNAEQAAEDLNSSRFFSTVCIPLIHHDATLRVNVADKQLLS
eukprot:GFKZ01006275.1.p1 GENE.GFKZ01006275.1~~GFKZ01006275.1.p1  ORF type:complete len:166 (-),score=6.53 GFKZ01006275.1:996-1493(-)